MPFAPLLLRLLRVVVLSVIVARIATAAALAVETIPPVPRNHFNDYAGVVSASTARELNERLAAFERASSSQVVVAIFPRMDSSAPVRDYTLRVAQAWGVGQKDRDNGVVLFAFMQERQLYLQVGAGLEQRLPDSLAQRIIDRNIVPRFRARDIDGGLRAGVDAILAAIRADAPLPAAETPVEAARPPFPVSSPAPAMTPVSLPSHHRSGGGNGGGGGGGLFFIFIVIAMIVGAARAVGGGGDFEYDSSERRRGPSLFGRGTSSWSGPRFGGSRGFGGGSSGGGSFSRGGGSFRGGGAGGKW